MMALAKLMIIEVFFKSFLCLIRDYQYFHESSKVFTSISIRVKDRARVHHESSQGSVSITRVDRWFWAIITLVFIFCPTAAKFHQIRWLCEEKRKRMISEVKRGIMSTLFDFQPIQSHEGMTIVLQIYKRIYLSCY